MKIRPGKTKLQIWFGCLTLAALLLIALLSPAGQSASLGIGRDVRFPDYFEYPNQSKLRTLVQGSSVIPLGTNRYRVKDVHIESFRLTGEREGTVDAPECIYDHSTREASSDGPIKARSDDGNMRHEGVGFRLTLTNKTLLISNIHTVLRDRSLAAPKP